MNEAGETEDTVKIVTNGRLIINYIRSIAGRKELVFEECELSSWLYEILKNEVDKLIVCNPVENRQYKRAKTDKLDAQNLAKLLRGKFLKEVYHDGSDKEKLRDLMSGYQDLIEDGVRVKNRYKSLFRKDGKRQSGKLLYQDESFLDGLKRKDFKFIGKQSLNFLEVLEKSRLEYIKEIKRYSKTFKEIKLLKTLPGISDIHAAKIVAQVINPQRFRTKYKYYSYCGLVRHQQTSGGKSYGDKKIWGNRVLKCVYKMAAVSALRSNNGLKRYYEYLLTKGKGERNAKSGVCRKLAEISLAMLKKGEKYCEKKIQTV